MIIRQTEHMDSYSSREQGLTLVELMVSMSLGLIVSAAAFQLFIHSMEAQRIQISAANIQEAAVFNLASMNHEISKANLGSQLPMTQQSAWTGIVFTASNNSREVNTSGQFLQQGNLRGISGVDTDLLTRSHAGPSNVKSPRKSDQLTIQYRAAVDGFDCEGRKVDQGDMVIERFFTRLDRQKFAGENKNMAIVLACDAGRYHLPSTLDADNIVNDNQKISHFGDKGVIIINRVDFFEVKLAVRMQHGVVYMPIDTYLTTATNASGYAFNAPIVAIQFAIIGRGNHAIHTGQTEKTVFYLNDEQRHIQIQQPSYLRRALQSVVFLSNGKSDF